MAKLLRLKESCKEGKTMAPIIKVKTGIGVIYQPVSGKPYFCAGSHYIVQCNSRKNTTHIHVSLDLFLNPNCIFC